MVADAALGVVEIGGAVVGGQRRETIADLEKRLLVAHAKIRMRVLGEGQGRREWHARINRRGHAAETRRRAEAAERAGAVAGWRLDDVVPVVGRTEYHFVARRSEGVAVFHR